MIVFSYNPNGITVIRTFQRGLSGGNQLTRPQGIGRLQFVNGWLWDKKTHFETYHTLDNSEKRQIIGMLDALNQQPIRPITEMKQRWEEIIGLNCDCSFCI